MAQLRHIAPQSVQALQAHDRAKIEADARAVGEQVVQIDLSACRSKQDVLDAIARGFGFADWFGANLDALYDSLTDLEAQGDHGYVVLLEHVPTTHDFDAHTRDALLDAFRDAAEFHAETRLPFRVFYGLD
mgnify:FL=1